MESYIPSRQTIWLAVASVRGLLNSDLHALHPQQSDIRRCQVYCDRPRLCNEQNILQHLVFAVCWTKHLSRDKNIDHAALRHPDPVDALLDLLLDINRISLHCAFPVQPTSIRIFGLHNRLPVSEYLHALSP